jgi:hypothetical protein
MRRFVPALASLGALALVTGAIFALRPVAPVVSLGVLYLHVYLSHLRRKIEPDPTPPCYLLTEPGIGYRLVDPA